MEPKRWFGHALPWPGTDRNRRPDPSASGVRPVAIAHHIARDIGSALDGGLLGHEMDRDNGRRAPRGLNSHWSGRRSGDQFCVYVCDRFVVPHLSDQQQAQIGYGVLSLDTLTREHIHDHFEYRYVTIGNGKDAFALEREVQRGGR